MKLPKISIYNRKKYGEDKQSTSGDYNANYLSVEKHCP